MKLSIRTRERQAIRQMALARGNVQVMCTFQIVPEYYSLTLFSGLFSEFFVKRNTIQLTSSSSTEPARTVYIYTPDIYIPLELSVGIQSQKWFRSKPIGVVVSFSSRLTSEAQPPRILTQPEELPYIYVSICLHLIIKPCTLDSSLLILLRVPPMMNFYCSEKQ